MAYRKKKMRLRTRTIVAGCVGLLGAAIGAIAWQQNAAGPQIRPSEKFIEYRDREFRLSYPDNWRAFGDRDFAGVIIAPPEAHRELPRGGTSIGCGAVVSFFYTGGRRVNLDKATKELIEGLRTTNPGLRVEGTGTRKVRAAGREARLTIFRGPSPFDGLNEIGRLITLSWKQGLLYIVFIAPETQMPALEPVFDRILASLKLGD